MERAISDPPSGIGSTAAVGGVTFHPLKVASVEPLTEDSVVVEFVVPDDLRDVFRYLPGQHVTVRADIDGADVRRSYSICTDAGIGRIRVGIRRLMGGVFSTFATTRLAAGDELGVTAPSGEFWIAPGTSGHFAAIVAGSGITPVLSMVSTTLASDPRTRWTVVYGNREARSVMFLEDLEALKDRYPDRLQLIHVLSREDTGLDLTSGRIDAPRLQRLFATLLPPSSVDTWFLCGPYEMVMTAREELSGAGVPEGAVLDELFFAGPPTDLPPPPPEDEAGTVSLTFTLQGRSTSTRMRPTSSVLDAAMAVRSELPFSCKGGMCATCKARVVEGAVTMDKNYALVDADLAAGYVLTCQSHPTTPSVVVDFDQR
jgi:ring-1,2-phenylacetyl-CoA epoxidase subunit PaaE